MILLGRTILFGRMILLPYSADLHPEFSSWVGHVAAPPPVPAEEYLLDEWFRPPADATVGARAAVDSGCGMGVEGLDPREAARLASLDEECLRAACDTTVCPALLLLLQAHGAAGGGVGGSVAGRVCMPCTIAICMS